MTDGLAPLPSDPRFQNLTGQEFNGLRVIGYLGKKRNSQMWLCECVCGVRKPASGGDIKRGHTKSCGCRRAVVASGLNKTHGMARTAEYVIWSCMIRRCENLKEERYCQRGIRVCDRWRGSFEAFYSDMGPIPSPRHSIDRKNNDGHYEPGNCRWATRKEQGRNRACNRLITANSKTLTLAEWSEASGISESTIRRRLALKWHADDAVSRPVRNHIPYRLQTQQNESVRR